MKPGRLLMSFAALAAAMIIAGATYAQSTAQAPAQTAPQTVKKAQPADAAAVTFVGRGNRAAVIGKDGHVTEVAADNLTFHNRGKRMAEPGAAPAAAPVPAKPAEPDSAKEVQEAAKEEGEKAVHEALQEADLKSIEEMRKNRYMWFFDETGKVMTEKELDRRIAQKDLSGIKAMNDDRAEWTPRSTKTAKK